MENLENLQTSNLLEDAVKEAKVALSPLKEEVEYAKLDEKYEKLLERSRVLFERYKKVLWRSPLNTERKNRPTVVFDEGRLQVYDKEKGTEYALYGYQWFMGIHSWADKWDRAEYRWWDGKVHYDPKEWSSPMLEVYWNEKVEYELNKVQYEKMLDKIEEVLNREEREIKDLEKKDGTDVDGVIEWL